MVATTTIQRRQAKRQNRPKIRDRTAAIDHAVRVIYLVCCLAGSADLIDKIRADLGPEYFEWMAEMGAGAHGHHH